MSFTRFLSGRRPRRWPLALSIGCAVVLAASALMAAESRAQVTDPLSPLLYQPPVVAPIVDPFRPPSTFAGTGNRGLEYGTIGGEIVLASAEGTVTFAGLLAGDLFVTVQHRDGIRTSYSFLREVQVQRGQPVAAGDVLARAEPGFHFGVRIGTTYLDPEALMQPVPAIREPARLVPVTLAAPG